MGFFCSWDGVKGKGKIGSNVGKYEGEKYIPLTCIQKLLLEIITFISDWQKKN